MVLESALIDRISTVLERRSNDVMRWLGDDAAVTKQSHFAVTSIDAFVENVHFSRTNSTWKQIGHRALAGALSDIAAMGVATADAYIALGLPNDVSERDVLDLYEGIEALASSTGSTVCGGDLTSSAVTFVTICVTGCTSDEAELVGRNGARPGDLVAVTGNLGGAAAGRALVEGRASTDARVSLERFRHPLPRLREGRALASAGVSAMIDISDGVATDASHIAQMSGSNLRIDLERLPLDDGVTAVAESLGTDPYKFAATGGEDYELLVCVPECRRAQAESAVEEVGITWIGTVESAKPSESPGLHLFRSNLEVTGLQGYEHFGAI